MPATRNTSLSRRRLPRSKAAVFSTLEGAIGSGVHEGARLSNKLWIAPVLGAKGFSGVFFFCQRDMRVLLFAFVVSQVINHDIDSLLMRFKRARDASEESSPTKTNGFGSLLSLRGIGSVVQWI
jgi:hypothetical protein